jgi:bifunctional DNA-binding transcriptional regulator/antitoxin component of YhaV-PrlF toxin-antitoxin module
MLGIPKAFREEAGISAGDTIRVTIEADTAPRTVEVRKTRLRQSKSRGLGRVEKLSFTHRKEHVLAVEEAKSPITG